MAKISISIDDAVLDEIDERLTYGDSRSAWIEDAAQTKLSIEDVLDDDMTTEEQREFVVEAMQEAASK